MSPLAVSLAVFVVILAGAWLGMHLHARLPDHHLTTEARDSIKLAMGLTATMAALVLGLVTASAKSAFDGEDAAIKHTAIKTLMLDRLLGEFGPDAQKIRDDLRQIVVVRLATTWPEDHSGTVLQETPKTAKISAGIETRIRSLVPTTDAQRDLKNRALQETIDLTETRWTMFESLGDSIPVPFLIILVSWLTILFAGFGLLTPRNATVVAALLLSAASVSSAIFLILEMEQPFSGLIRVSAGPLRYALSHLGQ